MSVHHLCCLVAAKVCMLSTDSVFRWQALDLGLSLREVNLSEGCCTGEGKKTYIQRLHHSPLYPLPTMITA